ncbi:hypothetical protein EDD21DRAFT_357236 [Dissophora ornata]|nr:hypothetical protein EDD21DRAFT_357236 [Dissophora ornata]
MAIKYVQRTWKLYQILGVCGFMRPGGIFTRHRAVLVDGIVNQFGLLNVMGVGRKLAADSIATCDRDSLFGNVSRVNSHSNTALNQSAIGISVTELNVTGLRSVSLAPDNELRNDNAVCDRMSRSSNPPLGCGYTTLFPTNFARNELCLGLNGGAGYWRIGVALYWTLLSNGYDPEVLPNNSITDSSRMCYGCSPSANQTARMPTFTMAVMQITPALLSDSIIVTMQPDVQESWEYTTEDPIRVLLCEHEYHVKCFGHTSGSLKQCRMYLLYYGCLQALITGDTVKVAEWINRHVETPRYIPTSVTRENYSSARQRGKQLVRQRIAS